MSNFLIQLEHPINLSREGEPLAKKQKLAEDHDPNEPPARHDQPSTSREGIFLCFGNQLNANLCNYVIAIFFYRTIEAFAI